MTGVILLLCFLLLILAILMLRVGLILRYEEEVSLFFKYRIFPRKSTPKVKEFSAKGIRSKLDKDKEKLDKQNEKEKKEKVKAAPKKKTNVIETVKLVADILSTLVEKLLRYLRVRVACLELTVATDDAAKTAIQYGIAVQIVQYIVTTLECITDFKVERDGNVRVDCDFCADRSLLKVDMEFSIRLWQAIAMALGAGAKYVLNYGKINKTDK